MPSKDMLQIWAAICIAYAGVAYSVSWAMGFASSWAAHRFGALDLPTGGRKIHTKPMALWGGLGIALAMFTVFAGFTWLFKLESPLPMKHLFGYALSVLVLLIGGMIDDRWPLSPRIQILFPCLAAVIIIASGIGVVQITNPFAPGGFSLVWWKGLGVSLPADLLTFAWLILATYATKILDGLDGLVTGLTIIGASMVGALTISPAYFQPGVAWLAAIVGGSYLGFLPRNFHPAKQFLGEAGSTIAGFSLGVLAILSSAKIAMALVVLAIPIADLIFVVYGRMRRGVPWFKGDKTHIHFRLLDAGLSQSAVVCLLWGISILAGVFALSLQTRGKYFLIGFLFLFAIFMSYAAGLRAKRRQQAP